MAGIGDTLMTTDRSFYGHATALAQPDPLATCAAPVRLRRYTQPSVGCWRCAGMEKGKKRRSTAPHARLESLGRMCEKRPFLVNVV